MSKNTLPGSTNSIAPTAKDLPVSSTPCCTNELQQRGQQLAEQVMATWLFPRHAQVRVTVHCIHADGDTDYWGKVTWGCLANQQYQIVICCDAGDQLEWLIRHELMEAALSEYADYTTDLIYQLADQEACHSEREQDRHQELRDRFIERFLCVLVPQHRPAPPKRQLVE